MFINKERFFLIISGILVLNSCIKKGDFKAYDAPDTWEGAFASPLVDSKLSLGQVINKKTDEFGIKRESDSSYFYTISGSTESPIAESLVKLDDQKVPAAINFAVPNPKAFLLPNVNITPILDSAGGRQQTISFDVPFADSISFNYILLKQGTFLFDVSTTLKHKLYYTISSNSLIDKNGNIFTLRDSIIPNKTKVTTPLDLSGYKIVLSNLNKPDSKFFATIRVDSLISTSNGINASESINFNVEIKSLKFKRILGQFKSLNFDNNGSFGNSFDLTAFDNPLFKNILLADPRINLTFQNSYGVGLNLDLGGISSETTLGVKSPLKLNTPILSLNAPDTLHFGKTETTVYEINKDNSNLPQFLFEPTPAKLNLNPGGSLGNATGIQFIEDSSKIKVDYEIKLPVYGQIKNLEIQDTVDYIFPENMSLDAVTFKTLITNELPINVKIQMYLMDKNYTVFDSVYVLKTGDNGNVINSANVDINTGRTIAPFVPKMVVIERDKVWYDKVYGKTEHLLVSAKVYTPLDANKNGINVKFFSDQNVRIKLALKVAGKYVIK